MSVAGRGAGHRRTGLPYPQFRDQKHPPPLEEAVFPEAGFLSDTHYTSQFFGFSLELPLTVKGHEIMSAVMPEREHSLLSLQFEKGLQRGYITIAAIDPKPGLDVKVQASTGPADAGLGAKRQPHGNYPAVSDP